MRSHGDRRTFTYAVQIHGTDFEGTYVCDHGYIDTLDLPDGTEVAITFSGRPIDHGQGEEALALARLIAKDILSSNKHQMQMEQTAEREDWTAYAPVVL